ncbi:hypothetical protein BGZ54_007719 [Gamsiella multidivaricata]|nr:hypothetical protein BGZ54_007719 [Gamsiella multidivaricata]
MQLYSMVMTFARWNRFSQPSLNLTLVFNTNEKHTDPERRRLSGFCATTHKKIEPAISSNALANSFRHFIRDKDQGAQLGNDFIGLYKMYPPVEGAAHSVSKSDPTQKNRVAVAIKSPSLPPLWPYHRHVKRVVLNFAHPQASPQMLVKVLERIGSCCPDQIQSLDLHANEKMQAAGLESPAELERLFGSNFSKLRYLRLQGGFIDNQLLGALLKGFATPASPRCRLSQVFLGPGSVTDSAIDKLIAAASHSLEVLTVTSCVDMSGGALANLLTNCPKLRVLSVYKVLARDKELLEGLGIDMENNGTQGSALESMISYPSAPSRREIVAPLERLELGTVKLTIVGVAEIIRGTCQTLRYLVLETQHLKDDFLRGVVASLCKRLEGLHFDDTNHPAQPQQRQSMQGYISNREQRRRRRFFDFGRTRGTLETQLHSLVHHAHMPSVHHGQASYHLLRRNRVAIRSIPAPRQSPWLGDTTTEEWVLYGDCSLWAMSSIGSSTAADNGGSWNTGDTRDGSPSASRSRVKGIFLFVRAIGRCLVSLLSDGHSHGGNVTASPSQVTLDSALASTSDSDTSSDAGSQDNYEILLGRFGVDPRTVEVLIKTLQPSLRAFTALQTDLIAGQGKASAELIVATECSTAVSANYLTLVDRDEIQLRLVMLLSVLVLGIVASLNTQKL